MDPISFQRGPVELGGEAGMNLIDLAEKIGARILAGARAEEIEIDRFYADDKISELLDKACDRTLVVSQIVDRHLFRVAKLVDAPAVCLPDGLVPAPEMIEAADELGTVLMISALDRLEIMKRLCLHLGLEARLTRSAG